MSGLVRHHGRVAQGPLLAVCGTSQADAPAMAASEEVGRLIAERGGIVVCGGTTGVMEGSARGAAAAGGTSLGLLPGDDLSAAAPDLTLALATGLGEIRNALIARVCAGMVAIGGGYGTLSEIGFMLRLGKPVAALNTWQLSPPGSAEPEPALHLSPSAEDAVTWLFNQIGARN